MRAIHYDTDEMEYQQRFQDAQTPKVYLSSGFGGGKTYALCMKGFWLQGKNIGCPGGLLAPSYKMYKRDVIPTIRDICRSNKIPYRYNKSDMLWYFPDAKAEMFCFTAEDPESIKGPNLAWFLVNEAALCSKESVMMAIGRVRLKRAKLLQVALSGTPEGFNWAYDYFIKTPRRDTTLIFGDATKNKHVAASYFDMLRESYDPKMQKQYIKGLFVNLLGNAAAWSFNRFRHVGKVKKLPGVPVYVSLDFNVNPMAATLWNPVPQGMDTGDRYGNVALRAWGEIRIESSNTYEMADAIMDRLDKDPLTGAILDKVYIFPDPSGRNRTTKRPDNASDFDILVEKGFPRGNIKYKLSISVKDCLNSMNNLLSKNLIVIDESCTNTISDLERCTLKGNVFEIDKKDLERTHWLDGMKNMCNYLYPIKRAGFRTEQVR